MHKYKAGDMVRVLPREWIVEEEEDTYYFNREMEQYCGKVYTIQGIVDDEDDYENIAYSLVEIEFGWVERWLEPANKVVFELPDELFEVT